MKRLYFGTDGVRGPYGGPVVNEGFFLQLGEAAARWLEVQGVRAGKVVIGWDTRASGPSLARALGAGLIQGGSRPVALGIVPTPAVSRGGRLGGAALGVALTASHNPASDNGVKFFGPDGAKLTDAEEAAIEALIARPQAGAAAVPLPEVELPGEAILEAYMAAAAQMLPAGSLRGWKVALDTANGATCATSPTVFRALGAELSSLGDQPNGLNINEGVGSEHPEGLARLALSCQARFGAAHDGDGDRCILCDEKGHVLDGDEVLTLLATHALARSRLPNKTLVVTVQSSLGVDRAVNRAGGRVVRSAVGDRYVAELMRSEGATLGGESSGHIVNFDFSPTGDGLAAALMVAAVMVETGRPLSELRQALEKCPQLSATLTVREKKPLESLPGLMGAMAALERDLGASGRVLVRYSGTEPKLRFLVEGPSESIVRSGLGGLMAAARAELE